MVGQGGAGEQRADRAQVDDVVLRPEALGAPSRAVELLGVALAVVEGQRDQVEPVGGQRVRERDRVEPTRERGDDGAHAPFVRVATRFDDDAAARVLA